MQAPVGKRDGAHQRVGKIGTGNRKEVSEGYRISSAVNRTGCLGTVADAGACAGWRKRIATESQSVRTIRPMSLARVSRLRSAALRLNGDHTAENGTGSGSSANGGKTTSVAGYSAVAAPTMVMPNPCPTMDRSVPRSTLNRWINGVGERPARRKTQDDMIMDLWSGATMPDKECLGGQIRPSNF